jgi:hypothetical protein
MTGIQYVTDGKGRKVAVQIDLKKHRALWEDIEDGLIAEQRNREPGVPYQDSRAARNKRPSKR